MSLSEAAVMPAVASTVPAVSESPKGSARFLGRERAFFGLLLRGALGLMLTLGLYRFWLATDVRRFLWGHTVVGEDGLEYTGTPRELLIGFLTAIALLIPVYLCLFVAALGLGLIGILVYVTFRFELSFAVGAIVAVLHDVLLTVGIFALLGRELTITMVGAILTIAGYSINDTIVVFDRIREGLASGQRGSIEQIMNRSINQTLSRTILTGGATLIPMFCLFLFGGSVLRDFALAILIGVLVGTYSSIFIASPIVLWWTRARTGGTSSLRREVTEKATAGNPSTAS